ncbi:MAG: TerD family protein, partial [Thiolinea sp.]
MDKTSIALQKFQAIVVDDAMDVSAVAGDNNTAQVLTLNANLMSQGFVLAEDVFKALNTWSVASITDLATMLMPAVKQLKGSHVKHKPMYPNFPQQVMEASEVELYLNALLHYYSYGHWQPDYPELPREFAFETVKFQPIGFIDNTQFRSLFTTLLASRDSLSEEDKAIIAWFLEQDDAESLQLPDEIPFHENKCLLAADWLQRGRDIAPLVKTATDILRIVTYLSGGDVSLADNTRFKSLSRPLRRTLVKQLERVINEEDIGRHRNKWVRLFHNLHVGDYSTKVFAIAKKARNNGKLESFYSHLEVALHTANIAACIRLLQARPGEFGRRLDHLLRVAHLLDATDKQGKGMKALISFTTLRKNQQQQKLVIEAFLAVVDKIPVRNLLQLLGHLNSRAEARSERIVFPKGSLQKAIAITGFETVIAAELLVVLQQGIRASLVSRFAELESLGKVWLAPELIECPLPTQQRSASTGLHNMARGTRLPLTLDKDTLRLFVYWKGMDIDLSATFHDDNGAMIGHVSYTNLKSAKYQAYHSGDITRAKQGASEFIDIDVPSAAKQARYLAMNVLVFSGPNFAEHESCFVGWMSRAKPNSNEVFEPATVEQKIDLTQACRSVMPVVFDLQQRQMVWTDLPVSRNGFYRNNVESSQASIQQKLHAILNVSNKLSLYELFEMHVAARG